MYALCTIAGMGRTNIVIDDELIERVMEMYGLSTKRETVHYALQRLAGEPREFPTSEDGAESDWWAQHFEAIRGHRLGE